MSNERRAINATWGNKNAVKKFRGSKSWFDWFCPTLFSRDFFVVQRFHDKPCSARRSSLPVYSPLSSLPLPTKKRTRKSCNILDTYGASDKTANSIWTSMTIQTHVLPAWFLHRLHQILLFHQLRQCEICGVTCVRQACRGCWKLLAGDNQMILFLSRILDGNSFKIYIKGLDHLGQVKQYRIFGNLFLSDKNTFFD